MSNVKATFLVIYIFAIFYILYSQQELPASFVLFFTNIHFVPKYLKFLEIRLNNYHPVSTKKSSESLLDIKNHNPKNVKEISSTKKVINNTNVTFVQYCISYIVLLFFWYTTRLTLFWTKLTNKYLTKFWYYLWYNFIT